MTFAQNSLSSVLALADKSRQEEDVTTLKKQIRQKEAEFMKEKALLIQQVELLKMQLNESSEREANLKKMNENIMNAIQNHEPSPCKPKNMEINEDHPIVAEIIRQVKQDYQHMLIQEKQRFRDSEYHLEKENQSLHYKIIDLTRQYEHYQKEYENKVQEYNTLQTKYTEEMKYIDEKVKKEYETTIKRLQNELDTINSDIERQVIQRLNEKYLTEQDFNETIIKYQKEQQIFLEEQKEFRKKIENQEKQITNLEDSLKKAEDENGALKYKQKQNEKKFKEDLDAVKKQREDTVKKMELLESKRKASVNEKQANRQMTTTTAKSRNKPTIYHNKENVTGNNTKTQPEVAKQQEGDDEEKNKLKRQLALQRCQIKKLEIDMKDAKMKAQKDIAKLQDRLNVERKKRMNIYEDKIDKNNQLLEDLLEKDQTIFSQNKQISKLQDQIQYLNGANNRSQTPNHLLSSLQESMVQNGFTQSMIDLNQNLFGQNNQSSKRLLQISPLRSLDLTLLNNNVPNMSFTGRPLNRCEKRDKSGRKKKQLMLSPKQIKRNRVNSVKAPTQKSYHTLTQSINGVLLRHSRDASIAEVNEDLYKDSVESEHNDNTIYDDNKISKNSITLPFDKLQKNYKQYCKADQDDELSQVLMQDKPPRNDIYYDSLENASSEFDKQETFFLSKSPKNNIPSSIVQPRQILQQLQKQQQVNQKLKKKTTNNELEDDDCLVNILDHEDTHIELQPTLQHTRQHLSSENLFKDISNTIETLQSFRNLKQKFPHEKTKSISIQNHLPKPYQTLQRGTVQKMMKLQENLQAVNKFEQFKTNTSQTYRPMANYGDNIMKSPSSPNLQNRLNRQQNLPDSHSSQKNTRMTRVDSCPSPLDENETVVMLGSGEKLRVKEVNQSKLELYQNQFKEQRHKFSATIKPPQSNKNKTIIQNHPQFAFRTRTNSLINSVCQEISFKMKFMPANEVIPSQNISIKTHSRIPSMNVSTMSSQTLLSKNLSPKGLQ